MALLKFYTPVRTSYNRNDVYNPFNEYDNNFYTSNGCSCTDERMPSANITESDTEYRIIMALPGVEKDRIKISLDKDLLSVNIENTDNKEDDVLYAYREFNVVDSSRSFKLGNKVDRDKINAEFKNGILTLTLLKKEEHVNRPAREITVE